MFGTGLGSYFPILVYLAALFGSVFAVLRPSVGIYVLALILPLQGGRMRVTVYPGGSHILDFLLLGVMIGVILKGGSLFPPKQVRTIVLALCLVTYLSLWIGAVLLPSVPLPIRTSDATGGHTPFGYWFQFIHMPLLMVAVYAVIKTKRQMSLLLLVMMIAFLWNVKNFRGNVGHRETVLYSENLRNGMGQDFGGSNGRAAYSAECTLFLIAMFGAIKSTRIRLVVVPLIALGLYCVLFSYSRGAYLAFTMGLLYLAIFRARWLLIVFFAAPLLIPLLPTSVVQRTTMTFDSNGDLDSSSAQRLELWQFALQTTLHDPIFGVGFDAFHYYREGQELLDTHNMYVKALVETGVVGLACLIGFFFSAFLSGHRLYRLANDPFYKALGAGFAAYMVAVILANIFGDRWTYVDLSSNVWILLALVIQCTEISRAGAPEAAIQATPESGRPARLETARV